MKRIFVSYKTEDRDRAATIVQILRDAGLNIWWDQDILPGQVWRQTIEEYLADADLCLVLWSAASVGREGQWVKEEAQYAKQAGKYLGVLIDRIPPPFGFAEMQSIHALEWDAAGLAATRECLLQAIGVIDREPGAGSDRGEPLGVDDPGASRMRKAWPRYAMMGCLGIPAVITVAIGSLLGILIVIENWPHENIERNFSIEDRNSPISKVDISMVTDTKESFKSISLSGNYTRDLPGTSGISSGYFCDIDKNGTVRSWSDLKSLDKRIDPKTTVFADTNHTFLAYFRLDEEKAAGIKSLHIGFPVKGRVPCEIHTPDILPYLGDFG